MSQSHTSCRDDYECSAPDLDVLVDLCMANGAFGARYVVAGSTFPENIPLPT
jgi:N-acetylgalactosamine kinase